MRLVACINIGETGIEILMSNVALFVLMQILNHTIDTLLNVFLAIAVDNLANAQELTKVCTPPPPPPAQGSS